jgi:hypothetical protein
VLQLMQPQEGSEVEGDADAGTAAARGHTQEPSPAAGVLHDPANTGEVMEAGYTLTVFSLAQVRGDPAAQLCPM